MIVRTLSLSLAAGLLASAAVPVVAQGLVQPLPAAPSPGAPIDPAAAARLAAQQQLTGALARIASNGSDVQALAQAGRAALTLGDPRAALGFLARAEQLAPRDPVIKAALGATMVQLEDPQQAMRFFEAAIALGGLERAYLADRGLAFDLMGDQGRAQADYAAAAQYAPSPEVTRRHAISIGISGNSEAAVQMLGPLLRAQDRAAWRSRAMIVAMNGRADEARQIAAATMPAQLANGLSPYFGMMDRLTPPQLAAAAHFGRFPSYEVVAAQPVRVGRRVEVAAATTTAPPTRTSGRRSGRRVVAVNGPAAPRNLPRTRADRPPERPTPTPVPVPPVRVVETMPPPPPPAAPARALPSPVVPAIAAAAVTPVPAPVSPPATPPLQPVLQQSFRQTIITPTPAPLTPAAPADPATISGPPDGGVRPGPVMPTPAEAPARPAVAAVDLPASTPPPVTPVPVAPNPVAPAPITPAPVAPPANTVVVSGWSLADMVGSIEVPDSERQAEAGALSIEELDRIAADRRRAAAAAATEARVRAAEERRTREATDAEARARAEREAEQRAEAEARRRHPARVWVQIATGAEVSALGFDYRRFSQRNAEIFRGQSGHTAVWNRTRRLVVGPFPNAGAARTWLGRYTAAGGQGFVWNSEQGEEVTPLGRR